VFGARGYHPATIEEIAEEAGLSNGAIYYNFASKEELFLALLDERLEERFEHIRETLGAATGADSRDVALDDAARDATRSFKESREWRLLLLEFVVYAARNPEFAERFKAHKRKLRAALADVLDRRLTARGVAPPIPIDQLALAVTALANGLAVEELSDPDSIPETLLGDTFAVILSAAQARTGENEGR
jgi:AcrR family transcriptional regulator